MLRQDAGLDPFFLCRLNAQGLLVGDISLDGEDGDDIGSGQGAEGGHQDCREKRDGERRLVHVAEGQVVAASDIVELVPEIAVVSRESEGQGEAGRREGEEDRRGVAARRLVRFFSPHVRIVIEGAAAGNTSRSGCFIGCRALFHKRENKRRRRVGSACVDFSSRGVRPGNRAVSKKVQRLFISILLFPV